MVDSVALAATAARLIASNGREVTIVKHGSNPQDSEQPWRGQKGYNEAEVTGPGAFVPKTQIVTTFGQLLDGTLREGEYMLFAANNDEGNELEFFDVILDREKTWSINRTEVIAPGSTRILYLFEVSR